MIMWTQIFIQISLLIVSTMSIVNEYKIEKTWNDVPVDHEPARLTFQKCPHEDCLIIRIEAPYFNDPEAPSQRPGEFFNLWDYEVVEAFFMNDEGKYLELEFGPYEHYLVLMLDGVKQVFKKGLKIDYKSDINGNKWSGIAKIPEGFFPIRTSKLNAYAIHGSNETRIYESLYPTPKGRFVNPDFHRLEFFRPIDFKSLLPSNWIRSEESDDWKNKE